MHRLHRVRFFVGRAHETPDGVEYSYFERCMLVEVSPAALEECRLDVEASLKPFGGVVFPPEVLWHSHFRRRKGRRYHPRRRWGPSARPQKARGRRRREAMLRDKQRILAECSTTERS